MATTTYLGAGRNKLLQLSLSSSSRRCRCRFSPSKVVIPARPGSGFGNLGFVSNGHKSVLWLIQNGVSLNRRVKTSVARTEPDQLGEGGAKQEVEEGHKLSAEEDWVSESQQKASQLKKRVIFGLGIGITVGGIVLAGGWVFTLCLAAAVFLGGREYFELVRSRGITEGMTPPPRYVSRVCFVICSIMPILTLYFGQIDVSVTFAAFVVAMALLLQREIPRFAQLSTAMFGLFYCGYLPCFWVKLRCGLQAPALNTRIGAVWPILLGGRVHWTVGLVATLISMSSIIAADTFAFLGGKTFGRTPLTSISPKKTWEGTIAGLSGCVATSVVLSKIFGWPTSLLSAMAFGFLNFFGSIFGDLTESMIKRDAGVKDSGSLIPGHGGMLDRADSYIFTGISEPLRCTGIGCISATCLGMEHTSTVRICLQH